ncbi:MAG TPA: FAD-dependent oxidoreductase [Solirubrobacterales bacterium]|nr:FAD-dependent oxidoreductase [Solirubrobacterales bacterium]
MKHTAYGYWLEEAGEVEPAAPLSGEQKSDVVVVGGGYTGMWAAWQVKQLEPEAKVVLLEADVCGWGPSGRNGGFCNVLWFSLSNMRRRWGDAAALEVARAAKEAVAGVASFCEHDGVDAWFRRAGYLQVSAAPAQDGAWEETLAACRELGAIDAVQPLDPGAVAARCASPAFRGGAFYPDAATVQPARLALGLRERLVAAGVEICERSPVQRLHDGPGGVEARTASGTVRAGSAVVAIGGAAKARRGPLRNALTVTSSHIVLTEPVPEVLEEIGWTGGECITDCRTMLHYFRTTPDGRIAFGLGGGRISLGARLRGRVELDREVVALAAERLRAYFPGLKGRRLTHAWGGPIDVSPTHLPLVAPLRGGRSFAAAGYTGNGVGPSHMVGRTLASLALDRRDDHSRLAFIDPAPQRVPPEPFHWLGGNTIRRAIMSKEHAESENQTPSFISRAISRIPELIGFHIGR